MLQRLFQSNALCVHMLRQVFIRCVFILEVPLRMTSGYFFKGVIDVSSYCHHYCHRQNWHLYKFLSYKTTHIVIVKIDTYTSFYHIKQLTAITTTTHNNHEQSMNICMCIIASIRLKSAQFYCISHTIVLKCHRILLYFS